MAHRVDAGKSRRTAVRNIYLNNGTIFVFGDCHYRPGLTRSTAHCALLRLIGELKPHSVICDGDAMDLPKASRHPTIGWETQPTILEELNEAQLRMGDVQTAAEAVNAEGYWTPGNHDLRFETRLAAQAPEFVGIHGFALKDHFPLFWKPCWAVHVNPQYKQDGAIIQHRGDKGGAYGPKNNALAYGRTFIQGHLHKPNTYRLTNANGTFYGVDAGPLAAVYGPQFINYTEARPLDWQSAFVVLTISGGQLLAPEHCRVLDEEQRTTEFRGVVTREED